MPQFSTDLLYAKNGGNVPRSLPRIRANVVEGFAHRSAL